MYPSYHGNASMPDNFFTCQACRIGNVPNQVTFKTRRLSR